MTKDYSQELTHQAAFNVYGGSNDRHYYDVAAMLRAAELAGQEAKEHFEEGLRSDGLSLDITSKSSDYDANYYKDLLTRADGECQKIIVDVLRNHKPIPVLAEEESDEDLQLNMDKSNQRWVVDPIDGTLPFTQGKPIWSQTMALQERDESGNWKTVVGLINCPMTGEIFFADDACAYRIQDEHLERLNVKGGLPQADAFSGQTRDDVLAGKTIETVIYAKNPTVQATFRSLTGAVRQVLGDRSFTHFSSANQIAHLAYGKPDAAILVANALEYPWDTDAALHIVEKAGATIKKTSVGGEPMMIIAKDPAVATALELMVKEQFNALQPHAAAYR